MTTHARAGSLSAAALDFELTPAERAELDGHRATCSACRSVAVGYRADAAKLRAIAFVEPPAWVRAAVVSTASRRQTRSIDYWKIIAVAAVLLAALVAAAIAIGAFDHRPTIVEVLPVVSPSPQRTAVPSAQPSAVLVAEPSADASAEPAAYTPPAPICPAPTTAPSVPDVTVSVGTAPGQKATFWGAGIRTCSTSGTDDAVPATPSAILSAKPGDRFALALPSGWAFLQAVATDQATTSDATTRAAMEPTDRPTQVELPVTADPGESIVGFDLWIISDDQRVVVGLSVAIRVSVAGSAPSPTPAPLPNVSVPLRWTRVEDQPSFADATMTAVAAGPDRYVAVGCATTATTLTQDVCTGASWMSTDGLTWTRGTVPDADHTYLSGVTAGPDGYLAWAFVPGFGTAFWASPDGMTWRRAPSIPSFSVSQPDGFVSPRGAVWYRDRFIAFGDYGFWTSPDGLAWSDGLYVAVGCDTSMNEAVQNTLTPPGGLLVVHGQLLAWGVDWFSDTVRDRPSMARWTDAGCWARDDGPSGGTPVAMDTSARGLVAIGYVPVAKAGAQQPPAAWHSPGDAAWDPSTFAPRLPKTSLETIGSGARGIYAAGSDATGRSTGWRSADGTTWTADPSPPPGHLSSIVATADGFLAVGTDEQGRIVASVWVAH